MRTDRARGWICAALISLLAVVVAFPGLLFGQSSATPATNAPAAQNATAPPAPAGGPAQSAPPTTAYILFDDKGNVAQIPFEFSGNEILMPIHINRLQPSPFIVDSRENSSAVDTERAAELHLIDPPPAGAPGDTKIPGPALRLPGLQLVPQSLMVTSLHGISAQAGRPIQGRVGTDILNLFVVELNYDRTTMQLHDAASYQYDGKGTVLPLTYVDGLPTVRINASVPGRKRGEQAFVVDTGFTGSVLFWKHAGPKNQQPYSHLKPRPSSIPTPDGSGPSTLQARIRMLKIASFSFEKPVADFSLSDSGVPSHPEIVGAIGNEMLRRFVVIFDVPHHRLILEPSRTLIQSTEADMSGMSLIGEGPSERTIRVVSVQEHSPARQAGVQKGDVIVGVETQPAIELRLGEVRNLLMQPIRQCRFTLDRNGKTIEVKFVTRRLL
jgi:hypothetical protein